jgi:hypothetical protein
MGLSGRFSGNKAKIPKVPPNIMHTTINPARNFDFMWFTFLFELTMLEGYKWIIVTCN